VPAVAHPVRDHCLAPQPTLPAAGERFTVLDLLIGAP
jgi:hypothetical protein